MGLIPEKSFTVRTPAWWDSEREYVLADYPGRDEAMRLAGHDWNIIEVPSFTALPGGMEIPFDTTGWKQLGNGWLRRDEEFKSHLRSDNGFLLAKTRETFARIDNSVAYEVAELVLDQGFAYETGGTMDGGRQNYLTLLLNQPIQISGDDSTALPFAGLSWAHDGSAALKLRSGTIRQVCQNTVSASEAEGERLGTAFTFKHTKNWRERVEDAKKAIHGIRRSADVYVEAMEELAAIPVSPEQRDLFVSTIVGDVVELKDGKPVGLPVSARKDSSVRVKNNIESERAKINGLFFGPTIPEAHRLTAYGLHLAGVEYFDHLRRFRSKDSYVKRTLLSDNPAKAQVVRTIRELVVA
jgi:phage/plasmid-like protein (TIGR03299 family)